MPARGEVEVEVGYRGRSEQGGLAEGEARVSERRENQHDLVLGARFAPVPGAALTIQMVTTPSRRWRFTNARRMVFDPVTQRGTTLLGASTDDVVQRAAGVSGLWIGASLAPFSIDRGDRTSWRLDAAFRPGAGARNLWSARQNGTRGAAPGGSAIRLTGAFSGAAGPTRPYLTARWTQEFGATISQVDESGQDWGLLRVSPASDARVTAGTEVPLLTGPGPVLITLDGWIGGEYVSSGRIASGVWLPHVLDRSRSLPAVIDGQVAGRTGVGVRVELPDVGVVRAGVQARWGTPYRVEHLYDVVTTPDTWSIGGFLVVSRAFGIKGIVDDADSPSIGSKAHDRHHEGTLEGLGMRE